MLVHIGDARAARSFERSGIALSRSRGRGLRGVFAMPVMHNYFMSHQWLREMKRSGARLMVGVYFRVRDDEPVLKGHYNRAHVPMTAARAARIIMNAPDARGYEVIVPRKIGPGEIHAVRPVNRIVGWRYYAGAHGKYVCGCPACMPRGSIKSRKFREAFEAAVSRRRRVGEAG
jgi:hypothetical protein